MHFEGKKVLFTAFSVAKTSESMALYHYLKNHGCTNITTLFWGGEKVKQSIPDDIHTIEINSQTDIKGIDKSPYDVTFRHTSVSPESVADAQKVMTSTQLFFNDCQAPIIGVTGTKGKGTTSTLISKILEAAGLETWLLGNVGTPALNVLPDIQSFSQNTVVVYEMSSFQLWDIQKSPQTAVVLMIEPDHLDVHKNFEEYVAAKANIARFQKSDDVIVFHPTNKHSLEIAEVSPAKTKKRFLTPEGAYVRSGEIIIDDTLICTVDEVMLPGEHNLQNICAAITAAWKYTQDTNAIATAVKNFAGLDHRLEEVRTVNGVTFYNDSFSSAPGAAIAAVQSFEAPELVIMGGHDKGGDFSELAQSFVDQKNIKKVFIIGENRQKIANEFDKVKFLKYELIESTDFAEIVKKAYTSAEQGDIVLLSPASASFGMFKNFYERGTMFKKIVSDLS